MSEMNYDDLKECGSEAPPGTCPHPETVDTTVILDYGDQVGGPPDIYENCERCVVCGEVFIYSAISQCYHTKEQFEKRYNLTVTEISNEK